MYGCVHLCVFVCVYTYACMHVGVVLCNNLPTVSYQISMLHSGHYHSKYEVCELQLYMFTKLPVTQYAKYNFEWKSSESLNTHISQLFNKINK